MNCEIGGLDCHVITTEYITCVRCIHMQHLFNALVHVIYSAVSGQCSHTIRTFENVEESSDIHHIWAIYVLITITFLWFLYEYMRIIDTATVSGNVCIIF